MSDCKEFQKLIRRKEDCLISGGKEFHELICREGIV